MVYSINEENVPTVQPITIEDIIRHLASYRRKEILNSPCRQAAVLMPLIKMSGGLHLLLTKRTDIVEHHKGQISFPGGEHDRQDQSLIDTALRESEEEIGLQRNAVKIIGMMDDLQTPTKFVVTPVVGYIKRVPPLVVNEEEVAEVLFLPLNGFLDRTKYRGEVRMVDGMELTVHFFDVWREPVWGATAHFINQLITLFNR